MNPEQPVTAPKSRPSITFDLRIVCVVLLLIIAGMFVAWKPWQHTDTRKITLDGTATIKAVPDEFVFYPSFEQTGTDINAIKTALNAKGTQINQDLQKLGVKQEDIQLDSSSYDRFDYRSDSVAGQTFTLNVTVTVDNQLLAQKVQDYLANTDAKGQLTSMPRFSDSKQKDLESQARLAAIADAKKQAEATANNLNEKLGKVISVSDQSNGGIEPLTLNGAAQSATPGAAATPSLPVTPGKNDVTSQVEVVFALN